MYLKKLEIIGFKSFAEKTVLDFEQGITAIVGPNGCGKTNVVDSIKWAVGEQSAKSLRSGKMEDVIFHGTDERKGISMAEVSLTFDNSQRKLPLDFSEVTITRRVFRSGEGQYFINKNLCRLKDIDDLFVDTGVGMKAYSVFEQGKMDLILSSKPEDRRFVFEEAAGITKYKERRKETLHKLEITENNLVRIHDIVKEVQRQINSIERQAAKARRYKKTQDELRELEIKSFAYQLKELETKSLESEKDKTVTEQEAVKMRDAINEKELRHAELRQSLRQIDTEMGSFHEEKLSIETKLVGDKHQIEYKNNKINDLNERNSRIDNDIENFNKELEDIKVTLQKLFEEIEGVGKDKYSYKNLLNEKNAVIRDLDKNCVDLGNQINLKKDLLVGKASRQSNVRNELSSIDLELKNITLREKKDSTELSKKKRQKELLSQELSKMEEVFGAQKGALLNVRQLIKDHEERIFSLKDEVSSITRTLNNTQQYFSEKRSEYEILSGQKRSYVGYTEGAKLILENKGDFSGVIGLVNDLIKVPKEYVNAVSSVLGSRMQWIVVDTLQNAYNAARKLHDKNVSQTIFLALELIPVVEKIHAPGFGISVMDVVSYDKIYEKLVSFLLGRALIVPDINNAKDLLDKVSSNGILTNNNGIVVDLNGIVYGGMLSGKELNAISRDTNIDELKVTLNNLSGDILELSEKYKLSQEGLVQEERHLEAAKNNLYNEEISLGVQENDFLRHKSSYDSLCEEIQILELDEKEGIGEKTTLETAKINKEKELELITEELRLLYDEINKNSELLKGLQGRKEAEERAHTQIKISLIGVEEKENLLEFKKTEIQRQADAFANAINKLSAERIENDALTRNLAVEITQFEKEISELSVKGSEITDKFEVIKDKRKRIDAELAKSEDDLKKERELADGIYSRLNERQLRLSEMNLKIENITQKLQDEFKMTRENIDSVSLEGVVIDAVEQEVITLKDKLDGMGEVSLMAITEQDELVKRHEFLNTQRQDLVNAKEALLKAIAKLNTTTKKLFWDTFCQIKENFNNIFCQLFGGGKADLALIDESDILESGIEIIARPPGKRLQNVSLLSGGEKALTAIALLFSMFKVKPSPFCIMDEIDAPLDDSNIERFVSLLKEVAKTSQFLIVTHNKRTISAAQSLYGITMQESGVSKVVSVKFAPAPVETK